MLNEKKFRSIYDSFQESGLTIRDYCANQQMNEAKFYYWQNKLKGQLPPKRGFVPVVFGDGKNLRQLQVPDTAHERKESFLTPATVDKTISCEINYPNGVCVKLNGLSDPRVLQSLLVLMRR
ncbi:MAG TPA: hypothetical protein DEH15_05840 [Marinilabiliales bacterium]|nr:hypothetical protein [Marinilabiliales bacterium]